MKVGSLTLLAVLAVLVEMACQDSPSPVAIDPVREASSGPVAATTACPCWDEAQLATAFPAAHLYRDVDGVASLNRFDHQNAQQIQALLSITSDGVGNCELASFGSSGRIEALAVAEDLTASQCETCSSLLALFADRTAPTKLVAHEPME
jgi:hypothetical protein